MLNPIISLLGLSGDHALRQKLLFNNLNQGDIFIDCGANVGQETLPALKKGAEVYAFEPHPEAFATMKKKVGDSKKAHLFNQGVWDKEDTLKLFLHQKHNENAVAFSTGASLVSEKSNVDKSQFVEVKVIDLSQFIKKLNKPIKALKIDVEGVEFDIIEKMIKEETYKNIGTILVETHADKMPELREREAEIKKLIKDKKITNISLDWV